MNLGAKVPGAGEPCREDGEDMCFELFRTREDMPKSASELFRECAATGSRASGDCMIADFERACPGGGPGEGLPLVLPKGLLRHRGLCGTCDAMLHEKNERV